MKHFDHPARSCALTSTAALECWTYIASVDDFDLCDPVQFIRIFPRLLPRTGTVPVALRGHITRCVAVLAWRSMASGDGAPMAILCAGPSLGLADFATLGAQEHDRWFTSAATDPSVPRAAPAPSTGGGLDDREAFAVVNALRREIDGASLRAFDPDSAALFAFATGIHPAYLWAEAVLSHEFYTAVGWLGQLWRRRRADMPGDLAEYFDDVIDLGADGTLSVRDRYLARFLHEADILPEIRRVVRARLSGSPAVAVWPGIAPWAAAAASGPSRGMSGQDGRPS